MQICSNNHDEIVWHGGFCPLCEANETIKLSGISIQEINNKYKESENRVIELLENKTS